MNFANNNIDFQSNMQVKSFVVNLKKFKQLKQLNLEHNPFEH